MTIEDTKKPGPRFVRALVEMAHKGTPMWLPANGNENRLEASAGIIELSVERTGNGNPETHLLEATEWVNGRTSISITSQEEPNVSALYHTALEKARQRRKQLSFLAGELKHNVSEREDDHTGVMTIAVSLAHATRNHSLEWRSHHRRERVIHMTKSAFAAYRVEQNVQDATLTVMSSGKLLAACTEARADQGPVGELLLCITEAREENACEALGDENASWETLHILKSLM